MSHQGPTPVMGAPGTPIRSGAASKHGTAQEPRPSHGARKFGRVGLANKKRFAITVSAVVAAVLVPVFATTAVSGGTFISHGVSVERPAVSEDYVIDTNPVELSAYSQAAIVDSSASQIQASDTSDSQAKSVTQDTYAQGGQVSADTSSTGGSESASSTEPSGSGDDNGIAAQAEEAEATPEPTQDPFDALAPGVTSDAVVQLQQRLMDLDYLENDEPTNYYGSQTQQAVGYFQRKHGLTVDGYAGPETQALLFSDQAKVYTVTEGAEGMDVYSIQQRLEELGYLSGPTGYFGDKTTYAVQYFQRMNGITDDGSVGTMTKDKLFSEHAVPAIKEEPKPAPDTTTESGSAGSGGAAESGGGNAGASSGGGGGSSSSGESSGGTSSGGGAAAQPETPATPAPATPAATPEPTPKPEPPKEETGGDAPAPNASGVEGFIAAATAQQGKPYVLGGKGPNVFDCSGLVYYALNKSGYKIGYMTSGGWANSSFPSISWNNLQRGDVVCITGHVAVYLGDGMMCDASSSNGRIMIRAMGNWARNNFICGKRVF